MISDAVEKASSTYNLPQLTAMPSFGGMSAKNLTILVTGSNGLLGQKIIRGYSNRTDIRLIATARGADRIEGVSGYEFHSMDVTSESEVQSVFEMVQPDVVIHTAAMTQVDQCEDDRDECDRLNVHAVRNIVKACEDFQVHLVHLSTDFIFDGTEGPYDESGMPNPLSYYGESKLQAEEVIKSSNCTWAIARTVLVIGIVPGLSRSNIVLWAVGALSKGQTINVVDDQFRTPTLAEDLADGCMLLASQKAEGIYNISGPDDMSILELVRRVARYWNLDEGLIHPVSSATLNQRAVRPPKTGFIIDKAKETLGYSPRNFEQALSVLKSQMVDVAN